MTRLTLANFPEVFVSNTQIAFFVSRELKSGRLRKLAKRLYTKNLRDSPEKLVQRYLWTIVAAFFPGSLICDRKATN